MYMPWFIILLIFILGFLIGIMNQRWIYFSRTGKHLQHLPKNKKNEMQ